MTGYKHTGYSLRIMRLSLPITAVGFLACLSAHAHAQNDPSQMDRAAVEAIMKKYPFPKNLAPADKAALQALAKSGVQILDDSLPDYPSARFRDVFGVLKQEWDSFQRSYYICGQINAKNRFGGYTGWQTFYIGNDKPAVGIEFHTENDISGAIMIPATCTVPEDGRALFDRDFSYQQILSPKK